MKILEVSKKKEVAIEGTNCFNCKFSKGSKPMPIKEGDTNAQGGTDPQNDKEMKLAKEADLITLPGVKHSDHKQMCSHPKIKQYIAEHMCCAYWDSPGTYRSYGKQVIGK